jgi:hypothetical protein
MKKLADASSGPEAVAHDYVESWLDGDVERVRGCLHPELAKRRLADPAAGSMALHEVPYDRMVSLTGEGRGRSLGRAYEVTLLDASASMAVVRVVTDAFVDHLQLARFGERWLIVNVLYEPR